MQGIASTTTPTTDTDTLYVYVQLRPGTQVVRRCISHLNHLLAQHPGADVSAAGLEHGADSINLTIAVNPGPADQIAKFGPEVVAAYDFVAAVFSDMFDYLPQYTTEPSAEARATAEKIPGLISNPETSAAAGAIAV